MRAVAIALVLVLPVTTMAHSGGTDSNGCHTDSSTGDYHCHTGSSGGTQSNSGGGSAIGAVLISLGLVGSVAALFTLPHASAECAKVPSSEPCGPMLLWWALLGVSLAAVIGSLFFIGSSGGSETQAAMVPSFRWQF